MVFLVSSSSDPLKDTAIHEKEDIYRFGLQGGQLSLGHFIVQILVGVPASSQGKVGNDEHGAYKNDQD